MVQPVVAHAVEPSVLQRNPGGLRSPVDEPAGRVAHSDRLWSEDGQQGLGDHPGRVCEVDQPGVRAELPHLPGEFQHPGNRAQGVGDPAGSRGFLSQQAKVLRHAFIRDASGRAAWADRGEHHVRAHERVRQRRRGADRRRPVAFPGKRGGHGREDRRDGTEPAGVDVVQHQFGGQPRKGARAQRPVHQGNPESAAAGDHEPHNQQSRPDGGSPLSHGGGRAYRAGHGRHPRPAASTRSPPSARPSDGEFDLILAGTVFQDIIFTGLPHAPEPGTEIWSEGMGSCPGGVANQAIAAARLGLKTGLAAAFGDDGYGDYNWKILAGQEHVDLSLSPPHPRGGTPRSPYP